MGRILCQLCLRYKGLSTIAHMKLVGDDLLDLPVMLNLLAVDPETTVTFNI